MADPFKQPSLNIDLPDLNSLQAKMSGLDLAGEVAKGHIRDAHASVAENNRSFTQLVDGMTSAMSDQFARADTAMEKMQRARMLPRGLAKIIGYFDEDMNVDVQQLEAQQAASNLQNIQSKIELANTSRKMANEAARHDIDFAKLSFSMAADEATRGIQNARLAMEFEDFLDAEKTEALDSMSIAELSELHERAKKGEDVGFGEGTLATTILARKGRTEAHKQLRMANIAADYAADKRSAEDLRDEELTAELEKASAGQTTSLSFGILQSEKQRRDNLSMTMERLRVGLQVDKAQLGAASLKAQEAAMKRALGNMTEEVLSNLFQEAQSKGSASVNLGKDEQGKPLSVTFSLDMISDALTTRRGQEEAEAGFQAQKLINASTNMLKMQDAANQARSIAGLHGGDMPPELQNQLQIVQRQIKVLDALAATDPSYQKPLDERVDALSGMVKGYVEKAYEGREDEEKASALHYVENRGIYTDSKMASVQAATNITIASNPEPGVFAETMAVFATKFNDELRNQVSLDLSAPGGLTNIKTRVAKSHQIATEVARSPVIQQRLANDLRVNFIKRHLVEFASRHPAMNSIVDPSTGNINPRYKARDEEGQTVFSAAMIFKGIRELEREGIFGSTPDDVARQSVLNEFVNSITDYSKLQAYHTELLNSMTANEAATAKLVINNRIDATVASTFGKWAELAAQVDDVITANELNARNTAEMAAQAKAAAKAGGQVPMLPQGFADQLMQGTGIE